MPKSKKAGVLSWTCQQVDGQAGILVTRQLDGSEVKDLFKELTPQTTVSRNDWPVRSKWSSTSAGSSQNEPHERKHFEENNKLKAYPLKLTTGMPQSRD